MKPFAATLLFGALGVPSFAGDHLVTLDVKGIYNGAMLVNHAAKKLYAGRGATDGETEQGLWVFDLDASGDLAGTDERYLPNSPDPVATVEAGRHCRLVKGIALSTDRRRLFLGLYGVNAYATGYVEGRKEARPLVAFDLDEKGEPVGKPRSFPVGPEGLGVLSLYLNPKMNILFATRYYANGLFAVQAGKGDPSGDATFTRFGSALKYSLVPNDRGNTLLFGCYAASVEVADLQPGGDAEANPTPFKAASTDAGLTLARVGSFLYFTVGDKLLCWPLDKEWRPVGEPQPVPKLAPVVGLCPGAHASLYLALAETVESGDGKPPRRTGSTVVRFKPDEKGSLGRPLFTSDVLDHKFPAAMAVDEENGAIYVTTTPSY